MTPAVSESSLQAVEKVFTWFNDQKSPGESGFSCMNATVCPSLLTEKSPP
jgi:hypothetical protein